MDTWDSSELPTKFNKYKRLKEREEREAALAICKDSHLPSLQHPVTLKDSSDVKVSSASPMMWRSSDSSREESHELCPDGLALKKRLISAGQAEPDALQNGSPVRSDDTPVLHGNIERKSGSAFTSTVLHSGSPQLVRANGMLRSTDRRIICQCGVCKLCLRPSSANAASHCEESMDSSFGDDAPLNLTVSSSRAALSSSQWRNETNNSVPRYSRQMVITADNGSSRVVDEHFERSLGAEYSRLVNSPSRVSSVNDSSTAEAPRSGSVPANASDCVDDHFSKSLGDLWLMMKDNGNSTLARATAAVTDQHAADLAVSSVDDHFTKALGAETWRQIKANSEKTVHMQTVHRYPT